VVPSRKAQAKNVSEKRKAKSAGLKTGHYNWLLGGVVEEDGVGFLGAALEGEFGAIGRKYKTEDLIFVEVS
jgi:hypothetical protein